MRNDVVEDSEVLYRAVVNKPDFWKKDTGGPSSALFKDSKGCSVDRDGGRSDEELIRLWQSKRGRRDSGLVSLTALQCREADTFPKPDPIMENPYHALILNSPSEITITRSKARRLAKMARIILVPLHARS